MASGFIWLTLQNIMSLRFLGVVDYDFYCVCVSVCKCMCDDVYAYAYVCMDILCACMS